MWDKDFWLPYNFGCLPREYAEFGKARAAILPIPFEHTTSWAPGARFGPQAIISASRNLELYDQELEEEPYRRGICTLEEVEPDLSSPEGMINKISEITSWLVDSGKLPVALGGEHTITAGLVRALAKKYPRLGALQLDAHADLRESYQGTPWSHACVMRRVLEHEVPIVQVGVRSLCYEEAQYAATRELPLYFARNILEGSGWRRKILAHLPAEVYITVDLDVFDPSIMPAVGTPEPGGLGWYWVMELLREVAKMRRVVGFDVVELAPQPGNRAPDFLGAKLVYKLLGYIFQGEKQSL